MNIIYLCISIFYCDVDRIILIIILMKFSISNNNKGKLNLKVVKMGDSHLQGSLIQKYVITFCRILHSFIEVIMRFLLKLVYGGPGERMPPIKNLLLLESASSLALKIRSGKVIVSYFLLTGQQEFK